MTPAGHTDLGMLSRPSGQGEGSWHPATPLGMDGTGPSAPEGLSQSWGTVQILTWKSINPSVPTARPWAWVSLAQCRFKGQLLRDSLITTHPKSDPSAPSPSAGWPCCISIFHVIEEPCHSWLYLICLPGPPALWVLGVPGAQTEGGTWQARLE